ncbi:MAG: hypothetical protein CVV17_07370 [Gammaproteobacteria bacterium HGW-Gammaproteobacteria-7]|nr:MAG: hypothetical protein CVV17_07370 [Gammaproteobacteria bacterium HGW-Gammaproteobacteria-7]
MSVDSQQAVEKRRRGSRDKAKTGEEAECTFVHEHSEPVFNAAGPTRSRSEPGSQRHIRHTPIST